MSWIEQMSSAFFKAGSSAKKTYDTAKIEMKIKSYAKENQELYLELGKFIYESKKSNKEPDEYKLDEVIASIDGVSARIKYLEKNLADIKNRETASEPSRTQVAAVYSGESKEVKKYAKLHKKEDDLTITRTQEGIMVLRFCPQCNTGNSPNTDACVGCGYGFVRSKSQS